MLEIEDIIGGKAFEHLVVDNCVLVRRYSKQIVELFWYAILYFDFIGIIIVDSKMKSRKWQKTIKRKLILIS